MLNKIFVAVAVALLPLVTQAQHTLYLGRIKPRLTGWALVTDATQTYLGTGVYEWSGPAAPGNPFDLNAPVVLPPAELQRLNRQIAATLHLPEATVAQARHAPMLTQQVAPPTPHDTIRGPAATKP